MIGARGRFFETSRAVPPEVVEQRMAAALQVFGDLQAPLRDRLGHRCGWVIQLHLVDAAVVQACLGPLGDARHHAHGLRRELSRRRSPRRA